MSVTIWTYPPEILDALGGFGLAPRPHTPPRLARDQLSDLYRHEIRTLRRRLLAGEFPKTEYVGHVVALRRRYWPLALTPEQWERVMNRGSGDL
jgi:hypothetical protein